MIYSLLPLLSLFFCSLLIPYILRIIMRAEEHTTSRCVIHEVKQRVSGTWVSSGCSPSTGPRLGSSSSRCRINLLFLRDAPMFEQLSRLKPEQNCWEPEGKWIPAPSRNLGWLCLVWFLRKGPHQDHCWVINTCSMQVSGPGDSHRNTRGFLSCPRAPGKHLTSASNRLNSLLGDDWELKTLLCYYLKIYIIHLSMRGLKYVHFLEGTKDGNKYMDGWVNKLKMGPEKRQTNQPSCRSTMRDFTKRLFINLTMPGNSHLLR